MTRLTAAQNARIVELQPYLARRAGWLHHTHLPGVPEDEIVAVANLAIAERAAREPAFLDQTPSYVTTHGLWRAQSAYRTAAYRSPPATTDLDLSAIPAPVADLDLSAAISQALDTLDDTARTIAVMLAQGYRKAEVARHLGMKKQSIYHHLDKIQVALAGAM